MNAHQTETRDSPAISCLDSIEDRETGTVYMYDPSDSFAEIDERWISAEATLELGEMR
jgi:hypothetical protein